MYPKTVVELVVRTMLVPVPEIPAAASRQEIRPSAVSHCGILNC
jgi:hypothetical protein